MSDQNEANPLQNKIYIPIFEHDGIEITASQGKGSIFFKSSKEAEEFIQETLEKDPEGRLKGCTGRILVYGRVTD